MKYTKNKRIYQCGNFVKGRLSGFGYSTSFTSNVYFGPIYNRQQHCFTNDDLAEIYFQNGNVFQGTVQNGEMKKGTLFVKSSGEIIDGSFQNNKATGNCRIDYSTDDNQQRVCFFGDAKNGR